MSRHRGAKHRRRGKWVGLFIVFILSFATGVPFAAKKTLPATLKTSMSAHHILGLKSVPRVWLFAI